MLLLGSQRYWNCIGREGNPEMRHSTVRCVFLFFQLRSWLSLVVHLPLEGQNSRGKQTHIWLSMKGFCRMSVSLCLQVCNLWSWWSRLCQQMPSSTCIRHFLSVCNWKLVFIPFRPFHSRAYSKFWHYPERLYEIYYSTHRVSLALPCKPIWSGCLWSASCCDSCSPGNLRTSFCCKRETFFIFLFWLIFFSCRLK